ncbi:MAG: pilus assembly protein N-terminal domain-containing protein [Alphaproteobacteria bacterium]|nr:pilus assembly protein N-terminal domain-containing protein [Alphaproteobacteria bacterium]
MTKYKTITLMTLILGCASFVASAQAEDVPAEKLAAVSAEVMDMPAASQPSDDDAMEVTHPIMRMTPDKSELVKLEGKAASVIVGNPNHISVMLDTPDTLVVVPRAEGASYFTVIGEDGSVLMQRHVIVGATKERYVRIRRSCASNATGCQPTSVYFCPDMCHEVMENTQRQR